MNALTEDITVKNKIIDIIAALFSKSRIDKEILEYVDLIDDLGMDSVNFISLIIEIESSFGIQIPDDWLLMEKFQHYSQIYDAIISLLPSKELENKNG